MNTKHTPTPWIYQKSTQTIRSEKENYWLATMDSWDGAIDNEANANHIVKCVNMHDELINALESAYATINQLGYLSQDKLYKHDLENINNVLVKAKGVKLEVKL